MRKLERQGSRSRRRAAAGASLVAALALQACGPKNFLNDNDHLRGAVHELEARAARAEGEAQELRAKLAESERARAGAADPEALDALPRCVRIEIDSLSALADRDGASGFEAVEVYVAPRDARSRFVPIAGRLIVEAFQLPPTGGGGEPRLLARAELAPADVRDAYRASLLTVNYTVRAPIDPPLEQPEGDLLIRAAFHDGITGLSHQAELVRPANPGAARRKADVAGR